MFDNEGKYSNAVLEYWNLWAAPLQVMPSKPTQLKCIWYFICSTRYLMKDKGTHAYTSILTKYSPETDENSS